MNTVMKRIGSSILAQAIISLLLGLFLLLWPAATPTTLVIILGIYIAASGLFSVLGYFRQKEEERKTTTLIGGIFLVIVAIVLFVVPTLIAAFFALIIGVFVVIGGIANIIRSFEIRKYGGFGWPAILVVNILIVIGGLLIVFNPFGSIILFVSILGIVLIANGAINLFTYFMLRSAVKKLG